MSWYGIMAEYCSVPQAGFELTVIQGGLKSMQFPCTRLSSARIKHETTHPATDVCRCCCFKRSFRLTYKPPWVGQNPLPADYPHTRAVQPLPRPAPEGHIWCSWWTPHWHTIPWSLDLVCVGVPSCVYCDLQQIVMRCVCPDVTVCNRFSVPWVCLVSV